MLGTPSSLFPFLFLYAKAMEGQVNSVIFAITEYGFKTYLPFTCFIATYILSSNHKEGVVLSETSPTLHPWI